MAHDPGEWAKTYWRAMREIKLRQGQVIKLLAANPTMNQRVLYELCHLQIRFICELLAICCLAAHGNIPETKSARLRSAYQADLILKALEKLHPDFFPIPVAVIQGAEGKPRIVDATEGAYLTKDDVVSAYIKTGDVLHRGSVTALKTLKVSQEDRDAVLEWLEKLHNLILTHTIMVIRPIDYELFLVTVASDAKPKLFFLKSVPGPIE